MRDMPPTWSEIIAMVRETMTIPMYMFQYSDGLRFPSSLREYSFETFDERYRELRELYPNANAISWPVRILKWEEGTDGTEILWEAFDIEARMGKEE